MLEGFYKLALKSGVKPSPPQLQNTSFHCNISAVLVNDHKKLIKRGFVQIRK
jgi:hypothetical protein